MYFEGGHAHACGTLWEACNNSAISDRQQARDNKRWAHETVKTQKICSSGGTMTRSTQQAAVLSQKRYQNDTIQNVVRSYTARTIPLLTYIILWSIVHDFLCILYVHIHYIWVVSSVHTACCVLLFQRSRIRTCFGFASIRSGFGFVTVYSNYGAKWLETKIVENTSHLPAKIPSSRRLDLEAFRVILTLCRLLLLLYNRVRTNTAILHCDGSTSYAHGNRKIRLTFFTGKDTAQSAALEAFQVLNLTRDAATPRRVHTVVVSYW